MAMKILLLAVLVMVMSYGKTQNCKQTSGELINFVKSQIRETKCRKPSDATVPVPVPKGFDFVIPSVVKMKQCTHLFCSHFPENCVPRPGGIKKKTINVEAFKLEAQHLPVCVPVIIEEHHACQCQCEKKCTENEIFNEETCDCECDPEQERQCYDRVFDHKSVSWSDKHCSCLCNNRIECDTSMYWNQVTCSCDYKDLTSN